jgi:hypothetical protein
MPTPSSSPTERAVHHAACARSHHVSPSWLRLSPAHCARGQHVSPLLAPLRHLRNLLMLTYLLSPERCPTAAAELKHGGPPATLKPTRSTARSPTATPQTRPIVHQPSSALTSPVPPTTAAASPHSVRPSAHPTRPANCTCPSASWRPTEDGGYPRML